MRGARVGYFISRASTFSEIDSGQLRRELIVRRVCCEIPFCLDPAVSILTTRVPIFICQVHLDLWEVHPRFALALEGAVTSYLKGHMDLAAAQAYAGADEEMEVTKETEARLLQHAEDLALTAVGAVPTKPVRQTRPPLASLGVANTEESVLDLFQL